jgi:hypothetical protein
MASDLPDCLVATIPKNAREEFRLQVRTFKGHRSVDLRVFVSNGVELTPTPKGISIRPDLLRPVIDALLEAERVAEAEGLLRG